MTIEECYVKMGANYQDVIKRLPSAKMIEKFALKFKDDTSFQELEMALNEKQVELAFRAAHTLKGVCMNLGFDHLYKPSFEIREFACRKLGIRFTTVWCSQRAIY